MAISLRGLGNSAKRLIVGFGLDLTDKSAAVAWTPNWAADSLTTIGIAILTASAQAEAVHKLVSELVGEFSGATQLLLLMCAMLWCVTVVSSKAPGNRKSTPLSNDLDQPSSNTSYAYSQPLRILAKVGLLSFFIVVPFRVYAIVDELIPLPETLYGYIYMGTDKPVDGAKLRLVSSDGRDITSGTWTTDSRGFYIVKALRRVRRSDSIKVLPEGCKAEVSLVLSKAYEEFGALPNNTSLVGLSRVFIHHINCEMK